MGAYLSVPITNKKSEDWENDQFKYGVSAMQGWRTEMVRPLRHFRTLAASRLMLL